jgi:hypothetical protein
MDLRVESCALPFREAEPQAFFLGQRRIAVVEIIDRWLATDYAYFKVLGNDGVTYILRHDLPTQTWELTLFQRSDAIRHQQSA